METTGPPTFPPPAMSAWVKPVDVVGFQPGASGLARTANCK